MYNSGTRATPGGCLVGLFGLGGWIYAAMCGWAIHLAESSQPTGEHHNPIEHLWLRAFVGFTAGAALLWIGWRMARVADMADAGNPDKPKVRF